MDLDAARHRHHPLGTEECRQLGTNDYHDWSAAKVGENALLLNAAGNRLESIVAVYGTHWL